MSKVKKTKSGKSDGKNVQPKKKNKKVIPSLDAVKKSEKLKVQKAFEAIESGAIESGAIESGAIESGAIESGAIESGAIETEVIEFSAPIEIETAASSVIVEPNSVETEVAESGTMKPETNVTSDIPGDKPALSFSLAYESIRGEVEKPTAERQSIQTKRGNLRIPRRYHMTSKKMAKILESVQSTGGFPNPYRRGGIYHAIVEALAQLGTNQLHDFATVKTKVQVIMSGFKTNTGENAWTAFDSRKSRNELSGKDTNGRILQNAMVLQRLTGLHLYGEKLHQLKSLHRYCEES